jgi:hypothetical protein
MADQPATPPSWLDLLDEDIPVVDKSGKKLLLKGMDFVDQTKKPEAPSVSQPVAAKPKTSVPRPPAVPPPNLPVIEEDEMFVPKPAVVSAQPAASRADLGLEPESDLADIKKIEDKPAVKTAEAEERRELPLLDAMVEDATTGTGVTFADEDMKRRYRTLVSLFFRELRDALETKSKFTMPVQSGGMGMTDVDAERIIAELVKRDDAYHETLAGKAAADKAGYVAMRTEQVLTGQDKIDQGEKEKADRAFKNLAERVGMQSDFPLPSERASSEEQTVVSALASPRKSDAPKVIAVTSADTSVTKPASSEAAGGSKTPTAQKSVLQKSSSPQTPPVAAKAPAAQPVQPPRPSGVQPQTVSVAPSPRPPVIVPPQAVQNPPSPRPSMPSSEHRPLVADVAMVPRLVGPIEELRSISVVDFRRLSRDPKEAALKIKDKIDLLEEQSFSAKTQAAKAWQDSETNRLYLDILRASLDGKPVPEVISALEDARKPFLTKQEFEAIMELNRKLRFG